MPKRRPENFPRLYKDDLHADKDDLHAETMLKPAKAHNEMLYKQAANQT